MYCIVFWIQSLLPSFPMVPLKCFIDFYIPGVEMGRFFIIVQNFEGR